MQTAFNAGNLYPSALRRFLELESNWFCKLFMPFQGMQLLPQHAVTHHCASNRGMMLLDAWEITSHPWQQCVWLLCRMPLAVLEMVPRMMDWHVNTCIAQTCASMRDDWP